MTSVTDGLKCLKCGRGHIPANKWWLDRLLKTQSYLVANKVKYDKWEYKARYFKIESLIAQIDPDICFID